MMDTLKLCVSCKACRHECPTGVDMAKMKIEVLAARRGQARPVPARPAGRLSPALCRARLALRAARQFAQQQPAAARAVRALRRHQRQARPARIPARRVRPDAEAVGPDDGREVVLFADTFNRTYERENLDAALRVLVAGGYRVHLPKPADGSRPLCCGRTFLSAGLVDDARAELDRLVADLRAVRRARRADRRPRAELPADAARRAAVAAHRTTPPRPSAPTR